MCRMSETDLVKEMFIKLDNLYRQEQLLKNQILNLTKQIIKLNEEIKMLQIMIEFKMKRL